MGRLRIAGLVGTLLIALVLGATVPAGLPHALTAAAQASDPAVAASVDRATLARIPDPTTNEDVVGDRDPVLVDPDDSAVDGKSRRIAERLQRKSDATRP